MRIDEKGGTLKIIPPTTGGEIVVGKTRAVEGSPSVQVPDVTLGDVLISGTIPVPSEQLVAVDNTSISGAGVGADPLHAVPGGIAVVSDGVTIIGNGTTREPLIAVGSSGSTIYFNVKTYGATGNGVTDDTAAINSAAAAASSAGGGTVYFPNGTYLVSEYLSQPLCLKLLSGVSWLGQSQAGVIIQRANSQGGSIRVFSTTGGGATDYSIRNLTVDGNTSHQVYSEHQDLVFLWGVERVLVEDCELRNTPGSGIVVFDGSDDVVVNRCYIHDNGWMGIAWGDAGFSHRTAVRDTYFWNNVGGLHIEVSEQSGEILFDHCYITGQPGSWAVEFSGDNASSPGATEGYAQNCTLRDSYVFGGVFVGYAQGIRVEGNTVFCLDSSVAPCQPLHIVGAGTDIHANHNLLILGAPPWEPLSNYAPGEIVTNGSHLYECTTFGTSASSGGPTGTGSSIDDGSVVWSYYGPPPTATCCIEIAGLETGPLLDQLDVSDNTVYVYTAIADGILVGQSGSARVERNWVVGNASSASNFGINITTKESLHAIEAATCRGNHVVDFGTGIVTGSYENLIKLHYVDISDNTFYVITPGVMANCIGWEEDGHASIDFARMTGNVCVDDLATMVGSYPAVPLLIGGNQGEITFWNYTGAGAPPISALPGSVALNRAGGAGTTLYIKQSNTDSTGWAAPATAGSPYVFQGQSPMQVEFASGRWYALPNFGAVVSNFGGLNGQLTAVPIYIPNSCTVEAVCFECTVIGDATATFRVGIYADDGTGRPGSLVADFGASADLTAAQVYSITGLSQSLTAGCYYIAGVIQGVTVTAPHIRGIAANGIMPNLDFGSSTPGSGGPVIAAVIHSSSVTGALPATFVRSATNSSGPRIFAQIQ
jgi:hypothetical protein